MDAIVTRYIDHHLERTKGRPAETANLGSLMGAERFDSYLQQQAARDEAMTAEKIAAAQQDYRHFFAVALQALKACGHMSQGGSPTVQDRMIRDAWQPGIGPSPITMGAPMMATAAAKSKPDLSPPEGFKLVNQLRVSGRIQDIYAPKGGQTFTGKQVAAYYKDLGYKAWKGNPFNDEQSTILNGKPGDQSIQIVYEPDGEGGYLDRVRTITYYRAGNETAAAGGSFAPGTAVTFTDSYEGHSGYGEVVAYNQSLEGPRTYGISKLVSAVGRKPNVTAAQMIKDGFLLVDVTRFTTPRFSYEKRGAIYQWVKPSDLKLKAD